MTWPEPKPPKLCRDCGRELRDRRRWYCDRCRMTRQRARRREQARRRKQLPPEQRGYGPAHRKLRANWAKRVAAGNVNCARCGKPILPGQPWDLGHDDHDRTRYNGPECVPCNRSTARRRPPRRHSRDW